ncbi:hypothetical protein ABW20_dc0105008 [Dactylellina cionopaga]|nr:hypothetical protein ABW20_dc0105008 [Dactylellina cionopaga]
MSSSNIIPFQVPTGHLEPNDPRPLYTIPPLPDIKNSRAMRAALKIRKKKRERSISPETDSNGDTGGNGEGVATTILANSNEGRRSFAIRGEIVIAEVIEDILISRGNDLTAEDREVIKESFTTDNQAHYFAICYKMEQHVHHYGDWGTITTRDLAEVFRGYIGVLSAENELGLRGVWRFLHKLLDAVVLNEIGYAEWKESFANMKSGNMQRNWNEKGKEYGRT